MVTYNSRDDIKIGIEARVLCNKERRGVAQYLFRLITAMAGLNTNVKYHLFVDRDINPKNNISHSNVEIVKIPECMGYRINSWLHFKLQAHINKNNYDLIYYPHNVLPIFNKIKTVVGIHDVKVLKKRKTIFGKYVSDGGKYLPNAIRTASKVICMSQFTLSEIEKDIGAINNAVVVHEGISQIYDINKIDVEKAEELKRKYSIREKFILALAASEKYKNINFLVESFARVNGKHDNKYQLLLIGNQNTTDVDYIHTIERLNLRNDVICTGYIPDDDLIYLYNLCECFVFPSLYEGFGFPPLEAMACGAPVLTSNVSSMPEIVGSACIQSDASNDAIFDADFHGFLLKLSDQKFRSEIVKTGYSHAKRFSWDKTAKITLKHFTDIIFDN